MALNEINLSRLIQHQCMSHGFWETTTLLKSFETQQMKHKDQVRQVTLDIDGISIQGRHRYLHFT